MNENASIGKRIKTFRLRRGISQARLSAAINRSESWLSQVERGILFTDRLAVLIDIAAVLNVDITELTGQKLSLAPNGGSAAATVPAIQAALLDYRSPTIAPSGLPTVKQLTAAVDRAWQLRQASRYASLKDEIPSLLMQLRVASESWKGDERRIALRLLSDGYQVASALLRRLDQTELAWVAADRGIALAREADDLALEGAAIFRLSHGLMRNGRTEEAKSVALEAAARLRQALQDGDEAIASSYGALHLSAAIAAARLERASEAEQLIVEASRVASMIGGDRNDGWTAFGPTNVAIHEVGVAVELGRAEEVVTKGRIVAAATLPTYLVERRAHLLIHIARGHGQRREDVQAVAALRDAVRVAPEELKVNVFVREMVRDMLRRDGTSFPELRDLATHVGALG